MTPPWMQIFPKSWTRLRLRNLVEHVQNGIWGEESSDGNGVVCVRAADFDREHQRLDESQLTRRKFSPAELKRHLLQAGDLVLEKSGGGEQQPIGAAILFESDFQAVATNFAARVRPSRSVDSRYLAYVLAATYTLGINHRSIKQTTGIQNLDAQSFFSEPWAVPKLEDQRAIVDFLDREITRVDALIEKNRDMAARLRERWSARVSGIFDRDRWTPHRLKRLLSRPLEYGANAAAEFDNPSWPRYVRTTDVTTTGGLRPDTFKSLPPEVARSYMLEEGDLLFTRSGATVGKTFMYRLDWGPACFAGYLIRARVDRTKVAPEFLRYFTESAFYWDQVALHTLQATIPNVSAERYGDFELPTPSLKEQERVVADLSRREEPLRRLLVLLGQQQGHLRERRQTLVTAGVTGIMRAA